MKVDSIGGICVTVRRVASLIERREGVRGVEGKGEQGKEEADQGRDTEGQCLTGVAGRVATVNLSSIGTVGVE